jgi:hypothetical protein
MNAPRSSRELGAVEVCVWRRRFEASIPYVRVPARETKRLSRQWCHQQQELEVSEPPAALSEGEAPLAMQ